MVKSHCFNLFHIHLFNTDKRSLSSTDTKCIISFFELFRLHYTRSLMTDAGSTVFAACFL